MTVLRLCHGLLGLTTVAALLAANTLPNNQTPAKPPAVVIGKKQIEADWLRQDQVRKLAATRGGSATAAEDAAGGCDGLKDGQWGFHTALEPNPWWQVDLGQDLPLDHLLVYNRCDSTADRASRLKVLLSNDGQSWRQVYQHNGSSFGGAPDKKPLRVELAKAPARFLRLQLPGTVYFHLDEVEVFATVAQKQLNVALGRPATQSSVSPWSQRHLPTLAHGAPIFPTKDVIERGLKLADSLRRLGVDAGASTKVLQEVGASLGQLEKAPLEARRQAYLRARWTVRELALKNPLLDFDHLLFAKRVPGTYAHMSDQNYGWFSRPGGGVYLLENFKNASPRLRCLTESLPPGSFLQPELSGDGKKVLFAYCKYYPFVEGLPNKVDKSKIPEDAFYHLFEINLDGTGLRKLTRGKYDNFEGRYLPNDEIVFLSTRRGQAIQCGKRSAAQSQEEECPDSYVRCGGGPSRPVAVYTLHAMNAQGGNLRAISAFENFEWTPTVADDGRIFYSRWDYIDRTNHPFMSIWSTWPDGTAPEAVFGNYTANPLAMFEARSIPKSPKLIFTASAHHSHTGGSLVLLDPRRGADGPAAMTRLTPEVPYPESEGYPMTYFANPWPLSEDHYLAAWSDQQLTSEGQRGKTPPNALGLYLYDAFGNLTLLYRDPDITSMYPTPVCPRQRPPVLAVRSNAQEENEGRMIVLDVYEGLTKTPRGSIKQLRLVALPPKIQPVMNEPSLGVTREDPGKFVLGTVPVAKDGSAFFRVPAGVGFFVQALDQEGMAVQTMRSATYVQPGQTYSCIGCHEHRHRTPSNPGRPLATQRQPSRLTPGPEGSWPFDFHILVQPVLDRHCLRCHQPGGEAAASNLTAAKAYETLVSYGGPKSLRDQVIRAHNQGISIEGEAGAKTSVLLDLLRKGHQGVKLGRDDLDRLITWMDVCAQKLGSFGPDQERRLRELRQRLAPMFTQAE